MSLSAAVSNSAMSLAAAFCAVALAGCTMSWTEADGSRRILGLGVVSLRITEAGADPTFAGSAIDMTTIGLALTATGDETVLNLGYLNLNTARLRDNAFVVGDPLAVRRLLSAPAPQ